MKAVIIYYSQTGNTELIARTIQKGVKHAAGHCDIFKIKDANPRRLKDYDLIGIGCPVIGFTETLNVRTFINNMRFLGGKHAFPFATHGTRPEFFYPSIIPRLQRKGLIVIGMFNCYADVRMGGKARVPPYPTAGHPDDIDLKEAEAFGREMVERSRRISAGEENLIPEMPDWVEYDVEEYVTKRADREIELGVPEAAAKRWVVSPLKWDKKKCKYPGCQLCMENCPMEGIDLTVKPPIIAKPCMTCSVCMQICPAGAFSRGGGPQPATPPSVQKAVFAEFYLAPLAKAEKEGRFRRLVPAEDIS